MYNCELCGEKEQGSYHPDIGKLCFSCWFWTEKIKDKNKPQTVIAKGEMYWIGNEQYTGSFRGFDGRKFIIEFNDGDIVTTTNLWFNGKIPERFREELKDNAKFINEENPYA
jgi:hypothetical protein